MINFMYLSPGMADVKNNRNLISNQDLSRQTINKTNINIFEKVSAQNSYSIKDIKNYSLLFNTTHTFNKILLNNSQSGDIAYFMISNSTLNNNIVTSFLDSYNVSHSIEFFTSGKVSFTDSQDWYLIFNSTGSLGNQTFISNLSIYFPHSGYNFQNAINVLTNQSNLNYQAFFPYESIFLKMFVQTNRRVDFVINQFQTQIINKSSFRFYQGAGPSSIPGVISDTVNDSSGSYTYSWVSENGLNEFFIEMYKKWHIAKHIILKNL